MDRAPAVTVIVVASPGADRTARCLASLQSVTEGLPYHVVTVTAASDLQRALASAAPSDVVLLSDHVEHRQPDWLATMQTCAYRAPDIGIVGCRLATADGRLRHAGTYVAGDDLSCQWIGAGETDVNQFNDPCRPVGGVSFACCYLRRSAVDRIGTLDPEVEEPLRDADYCLRAGQAGIRVVCCGSVTAVVHPPEGTEPTPTGTGSSAGGHFAEKWRPSLSSRPRRGRIGWHSLLKLPSGYAQSSQELVLALDDLGIEVGYQYLYGPGTVHPWPEAERSERDRINRIARCPIDPASPQVVYGQGDAFERNFGAYRIGFTMLECDRLPAEWVRQANQMDEVWVPSPFNAGTFRTSGVTLPIHVIPLGFDPNYFNPAIRDYRVGDLFTFLSVFEWRERKAPELLLKAFNDEFRVGEPVTLVCHALKDDRYDVHRIVADLGLSDSGGRITLLLNQLLPSHHLGALYRSADCFVLPTRAEGWGLPMLEAMACGVPVIATDWSAHTLFVNSETAYPISVERLVEAESQVPYYQGALWAQPSYDDCRRQMRAVFENQEAARAKGLRAAEWVRGRFTWAQSAEAIAARLLDIGAASSAARRAAPPGGTVEREGV